MRALRGSVLIFSLFSLSCSSILNDGDKNKNRTSSNEDDIYKRGSCSTTVNDADKTELGLDKKDDVFRVQRDLSFKITLSPDLEIKDLDEYVVTLVESFESMKPRGCLPPLPSFVRYFGKGLSESIDANHIDAAKSASVSIKELEMSASKTGEFITEIAFSLKEEQEHDYKTYVMQSFQIEKKGFDYDRELSRKSRGLKYDSLGLLRGTHSYEFDHSTVRDVQSIEIELKDIFKSI